MRYIAVLLALATLLLVLPKQVQATENPETTPVSITVVVPRPEEDTTPADPQPPPLPYIYPIHVWESTEMGRREIVRVFQLRDGETSAQIPRQSFVRDGFYFELAEIVRREVPHHSTRPHTEVIEISTQTNDLATILNLLNPTMDFVANDGYFGSLALDVASIRVSSQGTRSSSHNVTRTREFPNLSVVDTSLVPRTITENGRTYNLTNVDWQTQNTTVVDHTEIPNRFTAVATFSGTATRTSTIGYTTTAEYVGQISKLSVGVTEFTAHFIGIPIAMVIQTTPVEVEIEETVPQHETTATETTTPTAIFESLPDAVAETAPTEPEVEHPLKDSDCTKEPVVETVETTGFPFNNLALGALFIGGMVLAFFAGRKGMAMVRAIKKPMCLLFITCVTLLSLAQATYAVEIPRYSFGLQQEQSEQNSEPAIHMNYQQSTQPPSNTVMHFHPRAETLGRSNTHFAPNRASPNYTYGQTIGVLTAERLGRSVNVIAGATMAAMDFGAGHFSFTGLNQGNTALIGHNRGPAGFFYFVRLLQYGDILTLEAGGITRQYVVTMRYIVHETNLDSLAQFGDNRLTLVTCVEYQPRNRRIAVAIAI